MLPRHTNSTLILLSVITRLKKFENGAAWVGTGPRTTRCVDLQPVTVHLLSCFGSQLHLLNRGESLSYGVDLLERMRGANTAAQ